VSEEELLSWGSSIKDKGCLMVLGDDVVDGNDVANLKRSAGGVAHQANYAKKKKSS
jgi:hypothetical protein